MGRIEQSVEIDAPVEEVFVLLKDIERMPEYMPGIKEHKVLSEGPIGNGTRTRCVSEPSPGRETVYNAEISDYEENRSLGWRCPEGPKMEGLWTLEPRGDGTLLSLKMEYQLPYSVLGSILDKLKVEKIMAGQVDQGLRNLQDMFRVQS